MNKISLKRLWMIGLSLIFGLLVTSLFVNDEGPVNVALASPTTSLIVAQEEIASPPTSAPAPAPTSTPAATSTPELEETTIDDASESMQTLADHFDGQKSYSNNDGSANWASEWIELDESDGASSGDVMVNGYKVQGKGDQGIRLAGAHKGFQRAADLSGASLATLSFDYRRRGFESEEDYGAIEISNDSGLTWVELDRFTGPDQDEGINPTSYDISAYASPDTIIRFIGSPHVSAGDRLYIDNIQIEYVLDNDSNYAQAQAQE
ncbi:MAG: hypothetical protein ACPGWR_01900 [Ardenticatenaceae bacterium]